MYYIRPSPELFQIQEGGGVFDHPVVRLRRWLAEKVGDRLALLVCYSVVISVWTSLSLSLSVAGRVVGSATEPCV